VTWTRISDDFDERPEIVVRSDAAYRLYVSGLRHCNRHLTDGHIDEAVVSMLAPRFTQTTLDELLASGLWAIAEGGYRIPGFLDEQLSKEAVLTKREARAKSGHLGGVRSGASRRLHSKDQAPAEANASPPTEAKGNPVPVPVPVPKPIPIKSKEARPPSRASREGQRRSDDVTRLDEEVARTFAKSDPSTRSLIEKLLVNGLTRGNVLSWFGRARLTSSNGPNGTRFVLSVPNVFAAEHIGRKYVPALLNALHVDASRLEVAVDSGPTDEPRPEAK